MEAAIVLKAERRGTARLESLWIRFRGPLGLVWKQRRLALGQNVLISPDIRPVREKSAQLVNRDAHHGLVPQLQVGEGAEFEALTDYRQGMDRRSIDWKTSRATMLMQGISHRANNISSWRSMRAGDVRAAEFLPVGRGPPPKAVV